MKCEICNKEAYTRTRKNKYKKILCHSHYSQMRYYGKILKRTIKDLNEIVLYDDYAEIVIYNYKCNEVARTKIDIEEIEKCKIHKWSMYITQQKGIYIAKKSKENKSIYLHRYIMRCPSNKVVDHINHDTLDNRKRNMRIITHQQNIMNQKLNKNNTSGHTGVYLYKGKWLSIITVNGKQIRLGYYENKEEAVKARKEAEKKYFGEYRYKGGIT